MKRNAIAALLVVAVAVGAGAFAVGSQSSTASVQSLEVVETECDDGSYESHLEQRPADGGTRVVVEDTFVGPSPDQTLDAALTETAGNYTLTLSARATTATADSRDCTGELHYRAVVFIPTENFDLSVIHGDETHVVLGKDGSSSSAGSAASSSEVDAPASNTTATTTSN